MPKPTAIPNGPAVAIPSPLPVVNPPTAAVVASPAVTPLKAAPGRACPNDIGDCVAP